MVSTPLSGHLTDRVGSRWLITGAAAILLVTFALLPVASTTVVGAGIGMAAYGFGAWAVNVPQQHRLITLRPSSPALVVALNASALYLGVSLSGLVGAGALQVTNVTALPWVAAAFVAVGLLVSEVLHRWLPRPATPEEAGLPVAERQPAS
jgi:DHA1 family inner membrane transport protein